MSKAAHTFLPWIVFIDDDLDFLAIEDERDGKSICEFTGEEIGMDKARENFDLIVRAVNSHAALVAALRPFANVEYIASSVGVDNAACDLEIANFRAARAALKLAESDQ